MFTFSKKLLVLLLPTIFCLAAQAQQKQLSDDQYFKANLKGIIQPLPNATSWTDNSHFLLVRDGKTYIVDAKTGAETESTAATARPAVPVKPKAYIKKNDLYIKEGDVEVQLSNDSAKEVNPTMSPDGKYVAYTKKNDLYTIDINTKKETRLTNDGSDVILNGYASWVYTEEILGRRSQYRTFWWSPDSKSIAFFRTDDSPVPVFTLIDGNGQHGYVETQRYPEVGDKNPEVKIGIANPDGGNIVWADFNQQDDQYFGLPYWKPDGSSLLVQWMNRKQNNLKIWEVNKANGSKKIFYNEEQKTWVDLDDEGERIKFLENGKGFILFSDVTGWKHMYYYDMTGKLINAVTSGKFTVTELNYIDEKKGIVYFTARGIENTARKDFYKVNLDGKKMMRLTSGDYNNSFINVSPDGSYFISTCSNVSTPAKMILANNSGKIIKEIGNSKAEAFNDYQLAKT